MSKQPRERKANSGPAAPSGEADDLPGETHGPSPIPPAPPPLAELFHADIESATDSQIQAIVNRQIEHELTKSSMASNYNVLFLHAKASIYRADADRIYRSLATADASKPILLVMYSPGGDVAAAYLISKLCREFTQDEFHVAIPRQAKSAATLVACGADGIHMGSLSELGPIDPQFGAIPALALKHSVEHIATLAAANPGASEMFADYLARSLRVEALGYYERVAESATQYAMRLLRSRKIEVERDDAEVARRLVYEYKDHGFVIDWREAQDIFGPGVVYFDTPEYHFANSMYILLDVMEWIVGQRFSRAFSFTGAAVDGCVVYRSDGD